MHRKGFVIPISRSCIALRIFKETELALRLEGLSSKRDVPLLLKFMIKAVGTISVY